MTQQKPLRHSDFRRCRALVVPYPFWRRRVSLCTPNPAHRGGCLRKFYSLRRDGGSCEGAPDIASIEIEKGHIIPTKGSDHPSAGPTDLWIAIPLPWVGGDPQLAIAAERTSKSRAATGNRRGGTG